MWTIEYKGIFIHGYFDRAECQIYKFKICCRSLHAAKIAITKRLNTKKEI